MAQRRLHVLAWAALAFALFAVAPPAGDALAAENVGAPGQDPLGEALALFRSGAHKDAARALRPLARGGDAEAQYHLGFLYAQGLGVAPDPATAASWIRRAALAGHAKAQNHLGLLYFEGRGMPRDFHNAFVFFELAAVSGDAEAAKNRLIVARKMTSEQITAAQKAAGRMIEAQQESIESASPLSLTSGVVVSPDGVVMTTATAIAGCDRVRVRRAGGVVEAETISIDRFNGLALLTIPGPIDAAPALDDGAITVGRAVRVAAYQRDAEARVELHTLETTLAASTGLERLDERYVELAAIDGLMGLDAPVFDETGTLIGLMRPGVAPSAVARIRGAEPTMSLFALRATVVKMLLDARGNRYRLASIVEQDPPPSVDDAIRDATVAVECLAQAAEG